MNWHEKLRIITGRIFRGQIKCTSHEPFTFDDNFFILSPVSRLFAFTWLYCSVAWRGTESSGGV